ncbi:MAG: CBS domain-containing protein [Myxococcales bacterium]|nr:CBS domain-containing protein [Myxococcales bacterium]
MELPRFVSVSKDTTVMEAARAMIDGHAQAAAVLEDGRLVGVISEHDIMLRVVLKRLSPDSTPVSDVMKTKIATVREDADRATVLKLMSELHVQHLPVVDAAGRVRAMLTLRHLLRDEVQDLKVTVWQLVAENSVDAPGG